MADADARRRTGNSMPMQPYYTIMRLPGEKDPEFIQMLPFTPRLKENLVGLDGGAQRRRPLRPAARVPVPEAEARLRPEADRRPHQSGSGHLAADHALEPAGIAGHLGHAARHPDRRIAALRAAAVPAIARGPHPRAEARHRRVSEPDRHGGDADRRARRRSSGRRLPKRWRRIGWPAARRRSCRPRPTRWHRRSIGAVGDDRHVDDRRSSPSCASTSIAPTARSATATSRCTGRKCGKRRPCWKRWRRSGSEDGPRPHQTSTKPPSHPHGNRTLDSVQ